MNAMDRIAESAPSPEGDELTEQEGDDLAAWDRAEAIAMAGGAGPAGEWDSESLVAEGGEN